MTDIEQHVRWCRSLFDSIAEGGVWGVPRSGLVFTKRDGELVLTVLMPWSAEMPITEAELAEQQEDEFQSVKAHFAAAGITVTRESPLTPAESREVFIDINKEGRDE
jgi:hypothetical protein